MERSGGAGMLVEFEGASEWYQVVLWGLGWFPENAFKEVSGIFGNG